jgi:hypothetical protein
VERLFSKNREFGDAFFHLYAQLLGREAGFTAMCDVMMGTSIAELRSLQDRPLSATKRRQEHVKKLIFRSAVVCAQKTSRQDAV